MNITLELTSDEVNAILGTLENTDALASKE